MAFDHGTANPSFGFLSDPPSGDSEILYTDGRRTAVNNNNNNRNNNNRNNRTTITSYLLLYDTIRYDTIRYDKCVWGFDYTFTKCDFNNKTFSEKPSNLTPLAKVFLLNIQRFL